MLRDSGYLMIEASDYAEALIVLQTMPVDVLLTDVNLPGLSGKDLATQARSLKPDIGIIFATGDTHSVQGDPSVTILPKPYDLTALTNAISQSLPRLSVRNDEGTVDLPCANPSAIV
ncbi:response regulator [Asaia prunellae]|uniref:response regulator n=1 Tax=Asaia prunellae TaxID=610245 RepID=UPI000AA6C045|nr:response regulator [Asaia prunellae]